MIFIHERNTTKIPGLTSLYITFDYSKELVEIVKNCTPCNFNKKSLEWEIPLTRLAKFVNQASKYDDIQLDLIKKETDSNSIDIELIDYKTKPYKYQEDGIKYGLKKDSWLLLDAPGLGKSLQMIYLAEERKKRDNIQHCLIICGINTLKANWKKEINKHSTLDCMVLGEFRNKKGKLSYGGIQKRLEQLREPIQEFFVITNIETLRSKEILKELEKGINKFDMTVLDEAHMCRNPSAQQTANLLKLKSPKYKIPATGTVILTNPLDAYVPLKWTGNDNSTYGNFKQQYCVFGGYFGNELQGYKNLDILQEQIDSCSLRRTKDLLDLPSKTIIDEVLTMSDTQRIFYDNIKLGIKDQVDKVKLTVGNLLAMVTRLRQATACPSILTSEDIPSAKIDRCCELVDEIISNGDKVVVFSVFKDTLKTVQQRLSQYSPLLCTGDIPDDVISNNIDSFQTKDSTKVLLCTTAKMGTGITLTAASYAIFLDLEWTHGQCEQCEDRIHRIGSEKPVFIYRLHCDDTFDMRVKEIVETKEAIGDFIVDKRDDTKTISVLTKLVKDVYL